MLSPTINEEVKEELYILFIELLSNDYSTTKARDLILKDIDSYLEKIEMEYLDFIELKEGIS